jgi:Fur family transcriptional regulator, ferric uptake regulator
MTLLEIERRKLHGSGRKATPQRLAVLGAIDSMRERFTPRELYAGLHRTHPDIGLVTVYRTLNLLAEAGLICRMERTGKSQSYARRPEAHHHHLVCTACDKVIDVASCGLSALEKKLTEDTGFAISEHHLEFEGVCKQCQTSQK